MRVVDILFSSINLYMSTSGVTGNGFVLIIHGFRNSDIVFYVEIYVRVSRMEGNNELGLRKVKMEKRALVRD
jgi:hypothetical protein